MIDPLDRLRAGSIPAVRDTGPGTRVAVQRRRRPVRGPFLVTWHNPNYAPWAESFPSLAAAAREAERRNRDPYYPLWYRTEASAAPPPPSMGIATHEGRFTRDGTFTFTRI